MAKEALIKRPRYQAMRVKGEFSDEEMARDWTLSSKDLDEVGRYRRHLRVWHASQLCSVRLYGRFLLDVHGLSLRIINYLTKQLDLAPSLSLEEPEREATYLEHRKNILVYLGYQKFDGAAQAQLENWIQQKANAGALPDELFGQAEAYLLDNRILLPGATVLGRLIIHICSETHLKLFEQLDEQLSGELKEEIDDLLVLSEGEQRSYFNKLKAYPPEASIKSIKHYLELHDRVVATGVDQFETHLLEPAFLDFFFKQAKTHHAKDLKRFNKQKRYGLMICFLLETRKQLLDHLAKMHENYIVEMMRECKNAHLKQLNTLRRRKKKALDVVLTSNDSLLAWPDDQPFYKRDIWSKVGEERYKASLETLRAYQYLEDYGYSNLLLNRYPNLRKYFASFIHLPFEVEVGNEAMLEALQLLRLLDSGDIAKLPEDAPTSFVPSELAVALRDDKGKLNRNSWELGLALEMKEALRSGDLYLPQSKQHVSFWNLILSERKWEAIKEEAFKVLELPSKEEANAYLKSNFHKQHSEAAKNFKKDAFANIIKGKLKLKRDDKVALPLSVGSLQKVIDTNMPNIRIEQLLMEVDKQLGFSRHFTPLDKHRARPKNFYKSLMATIISQATNLGVVAMSNSMKETTVDELRHVLHNFGHFVTKVQKRS